MTHPQTNYMTSQHFFSKKTKNFFSLNAVRQHYVTVRQRASFLARYENAQSINSLTKSKTELRGSFVFSVLSVLGQSNKEELLWSISQIWALSPGHHFHDGVTTAIIAQPFDRNWPPSTIQTPVSFRRASQEGGDGKQIHGAEFFSGFPAEGIQWATFWTKWRHCCQQWKRGHIQNCGQTGQEYHVRLGTDVIGVQVQARNVMQRI